ncbi:MAG: PQQ-like beta-propeller repeat protein [Candidatus Hydrogenedentes bacterium]|nr:PQQ-like beta-propeller repeat protein [Candidatus Hydrogenedentota bacterium]
MRPFSTFVPFAVLFVFVSACAHAEDWPQWRGLNRDGKSPETGLLTAWPSEGPQMLWKTDGVGEGHASMAVAKGRIFTTGMIEASSEGIMSALDLSGTILWQTPYGPEWKGMYPGARTCPTVDGERAYILSGMGKLVCLDVKTGGIVWSEEVTKRFQGLDPRVGYAESLLVDGDKVICTPGGSDASLVALNKATGKTVWTTRGFSDQAAYCSPILVERGGQRLIVTVTARHLAGIGIESGTLVWSAPFDTEAVDPNHSVSPVYEDGRIYITSGHGKGGSMFVLAEDGKSVSAGWTDETLNCLHGGLVTVAGHVYGTSSNGRWVCLELGTGQVKYEERGVGMGSVIFAEGMLYCYGEKGTLGLVKATPAAYELVSSFKVPAEKGPYWAHPAISDGRLYVRHGDTIMAFDVKAH